jgi:hypothetical protein|nr:MAG TPA: hypothetical protein [Caudoviricetes sp.]
MYKKEIDEIYELCKRVANEVPTASVMFSYSIYDMTVCGLKRKEDIRLPEDVFKWDLYQSVSFNPFYEKESRKKLSKIKTFLLELLIDGRCPLNVESDRVEAPANNGTDSGSKRASGGAEQAESVHS